MLPIEPHQLKVQLWHQFYINHLAVTPRDLRLVSLCSLAGALLEILQVIMFSEMEGKNQT